MEKKVMSKFNVKFKYGKDFYLWNTFSAALIRLDSDGWDYINNYPRIENDEYYTLLSNNGFVVESKLDEFGRCYVEEKVTMYDETPRKISFVIAPGMNCNYQCTYCFENGRNRSLNMDYETANKVKEFIINKIKENRSLKTINIKWFGGEPLLYMDLISYISNDLISFCDSRGIKYEAGIITNGSLFSEETCKKLTACRVSNAQITIDGINEDYCKSKGTTQKNFEKTIENLCRNAGKMRISIRLNIPNNSGKKAIEVSDYLLKERELLGKVGVYFAYVCNYDNASTSEYKSYVIEYEKWLRHMIKTYGSKILSGNHTLPRKTSCGLINKSNYCIDPRGELYKCEHWLCDEDFSIGNVATTEYYNLIERKFLETIEEGKRKKCKECNFLPICKGGCASDNVCGTNRIDCEYYKRYNILLKLVDSGVYNVVDEIAII